MTTRAWVGLLCGDCGGQGRVRERGREGVVIGLLLTVSPEWGHICGGAGKNRAQTQTQLAVPSLAAENMLNLLRERRWISSAKNAAR